MKTKIGIKPTCETVGMPVDQPAGGGKTTGPPANQALLVRGSTETMVMFGRLKDKQ